MFKAANGTHKLIVERDDYPDNPRSWDNIGTMVCFHSRYNLGDKHYYGSPAEFLLDLLNNADLGGIEGAAREDIFEAGSGIFEEVYYFWLETQCKQDVRDVLDFLKDEYESFSMESIGRFLVRENWDLFIDCVSWVSPRDIEVNELYYLVRATDQYVILPLYLYDHSGITISTRPFSCPWDSGQVGWIYASKDTFREMTGNSEDELFSTDTKRPPKYGDLVKVKNEVNWGKVTNLDDLAPLIEVDFDYNKVLTYRSPESRRRVVRKEDITEVMSNRAEGILKGEVCEYDLYLTGEVYRYELYELLKCDCCGHVEENIIDSCGGFYMESIADLKEQIACFLGDEFFELIDALE